MDKLFEHYGPTGLDMQALMQSDHHPCEYSLEKDVYWILVTDVTIIWAEDDTYWLLVTEK